MLCGILLIFAGLLSMLCGVLLIFAGVLSMLCGILLILDGILPILAGVLPIFDGAVAILGGYRSIGRNGGRFNPARGWPNGLPGAVNAKAKRLNGSHDAA